MRFWSRSARGTYLPNNHVTIASVGPASRAGPRWRISFRLKRHALLETIGSFFVSRIAMRFWSRSARGTYLPNNHVTIAPVGPASRAGPRWENQFPPNASRFIGMIGSFFISRIALRFWSRSARGTYLPNNHVTIAPVGPASRAGPRWENKLPPNASRFIGMIRSFFVSRIVLRFWSRSARGTDLPNNHVTIAPVGPASRAGPRWRISFRLKRHALLETIGSFFVSRIALRFWSRSARGTDLPNNHFTIAPVGPASRAGPRWENQFPPNASRFIGMIRSFFVSRIALRFWSRSARGTYLPNNHVTIAPVGPASRAGPRWENKLPPNASRFIGMIRSFFVSRIAMRFWSPLGSRDLLAQQPCHYRPSRSREPSGTSLGESVSA